MNLGPRGESLIKSYEQLRLTSYDDGTGTWTIGWGHTKDVHPGTTITAETAEHYFSDDVLGVEGAINSLRIPLTQSQFDALASLIFNVGPDAISGRSTIGRALRAGDWRAAWKGFALWSATPGMELGQARRRTSEMMLFLEDGRHP